MGKKNLEEVVKRATVEFPRALSLNGVKGVFKRMEWVLQSESGGMETRVLGEITYAFDFRSGSYSNLSLKGAIKLGDVSAGFKSYNSKSGSDRIKGIEFDRMLNYNLKEHGKEVIALWDKVREYVRNHLSH